jgi:hypothetical protein
MTDKMLSDTIYFKKGDFGVSINIVAIQEEDGEAKDFTDYTVKFKVWRPDRPGTLLVDGTCVVDDDSGGLAHYPVVSGNFDVKNEYHYEIEITKTGVEESSYTGIFKVLESG